MHEKRIIITSVILGVISSLITVLSFIFPERLQVLLSLAIITVVLLFALLIRFLLKYKLRVRFYQNWLDVPEKFKIDLNQLENAEVIILARTALRWLVCKNEETFNKDPASVKDEQRKLQENISNAIQKGNKIHFVLKNPAIHMPIFADEDNKNLRKQAEAAIKSYEYIKEKLKKEEKENLRLSILNDTIDHSMTRLKERDKIKIFILDLSVSFGSKSSGRNKLLKPVLIFISEGPEVREYNEKFEYILKKAISKEQFDFDELINNYSHHSIIRKDSSERLAKIAARNYLSQQVPPVSIQLLVTNKCTTKCVMCDHYKISKNGKELTTIVPVMRIDTIVWVQSRLVTAI